MNESTKDELRTLGLALGVPALIAVAVFVMLSIIFV